MSFCLAFLTPPKKRAWMAMIRDMNRMMVGVMFPIVTSHSVSVTRHVSHSMMFVIVMLHLHSMLWFPFNWILLFHIGEPIHGQGWWQKQLEKKYFIQSFHFKNVHVDFFVCFVTKAHCFQIIPSVFRHNSLVTWILNQSQVTKSEREQSDYTIWISIHLKKRNDFNHHSFKHKKAIKLHLQNSVLNFLS